MKEDRFINIEFNGKNYNLKIEGEQETNIDISKCLDTLNNDELFDYLYKYHIDMFNNINGDSYFEGKKIKSGKDLKNSIEQIKVISCKNGVIYVCGEYWCDPEHGFSIKFPQGKFIKSKYDTFNYNRDEGKDSGYIPICTLLGQFSDYM